MQNRSKGVGDAACLRDKRMYKQNIQKYFRKTKTRVCRLNVILIMVLFVIVATSPLITSGVGNVQQICNDRKNNVSNDIESIKEINSKGCNIVSTNLTENKTEKIPQNSIGLRSSKSQDNNKISIKYHFTKPITKKSEKFDNVTISKLHNYGSPGLPVLPSKGASILLPQDETVKEIKVKTNNKIQLKGEYYIYPGQMPEIIGSKRNEKSHFTEPNSTVYNSSETFPNKTHSGPSIQGFRGYKILGMNLYPIEYIPKARKISYYKEIEVIVTTKESSSSEIDYLFRDLPEDKARVKKMVDNPEMADKYSKEESNGGAQTMGGKDQGYHPYVIITNESLLPSFQILADWKNAKNGSLNPIIETVENIDLNCPGNDTQEKIRNFINDTYLNNHTSFVLLGGDDEIIPHRGVYGFVEDLCEDNDIPCDLYYGTLEGDWNYNGNDTYGETDDGIGGRDVDVIAEVYIGRATVDNVTEANNFVNKTIAYEQLAGHNAKALMIGEKLNPITQGGDAKDEVLKFFPDYYEITKLYDKEETFSKEAVIDGLNSEQHIINHVGHANSSWVMGLERKDVDNLTNDFFFLSYSVGCYSAAFDNRNASITTGPPENFSYDEDAIAEHFVSASNAAFAYIGNTRYGIYYSGSTDGPSDKFDREFFNSTFTKNITRIGVAFEDSRKVFKDDINGTYNEFRWVYFDLCLLGDPETSIHTENYGKVSLSCNNTLQCIWSKKPSNTLYFNMTILNNGTLNDTYNFEIVSPTGVTGDVLDYGTQNSITNISIDSFEIANISLKIVTNSNLMEIGKQRITFSVISQNVSGSDDTLELVFVAPDEIINGDIEITSDTFYSNETVLVNGIIYVDSGKLELNHTAFEMNSTFNGQFKIQVNSTGTMNILNGSIFEAYNISWAYCFEVYGQFTMRDSELHDCGYEWEPNTNIGLYIHSDNILIDKNLITENFCGIYINECENITIINNIFNLNKIMGLGLTFSCHNILTNNTLLNNHDDGISLYYSDNNTLNNNSCSGNNDDGITLYDSKNNTLINNTCLNNHDDGISLVGSSDYNTLTNNTGSGNNNDGINLRHSNNNNLTNNTCLNNNRIGIHLESDCNDNLLENNICNFNLRYGIKLLTESNENNLFKNTINNNYRIGIYIIISCNNNSISKNICEYNKLIGISLNDQSENNTLNENMCNFSSKYGIECYDSNNNILNNNTCFSNKINGITLMYAANNTLYNNTCIDSDESGIWLQDSNYNNLINNTCRSNAFYGIFFYTSSNNNVDNNLCSSNFAGVESFCGDNNRFNRNTCNNNSEVGIYVNSSSYNTFEGDIFDSNKKRGIVLRYSYYNTFSNCTIINSGEYDIGVFEGDAVVVNSTFDKNKTLVFEASFLTVKWYLSLQVINQFGAVPNATLEIFDVNQNLTYEKNTDSNGWVKWLECIEYIDNGEEKKNHTPHNITAIKYVNENSTEIYINQSRKITITLPNDWIVTGNVTHTNETIILRGNLTIENGGNLTFYNITFIMNCFEDGEFGIEVKDGGKFLILDNDNNSETTNDRSNITAINSSYEFKFLVNSGAEFEMKNSELSECGYDEADDGRAGLTIISDVTSIENSSFYNNYIGIYLYSASNNTITNNNIYSKGEYNHDGIRLSYSSNNTIINNMISNSGYGISIGGSSNNQIISNNISYSYYGILLDHTRNNQIINNSVSNNDYGIFLYNSSNNQILNSNVSNNGWGINLWVSCNNNQITNNSVSNNVYGIDLTESSDNQITNSTISDSTLYDFNLDLESDITTINTTFDGNKVSVDENSYLTVKNYLHVEVLDNEDTPIPGADLCVTDNENVVYSTFHFGGSDSQTDNNGMCKWILVTDRVYEGSSIPTYHSINAEVWHSLHPEFEDNPRINIDMSTSHKETFRAIV